MYTKYGTMPEIEGESDEYAEARRKHKRDNADLYRLVPRRDCTWEHSLISLCDSKLWGFCINGRSVTVNTSEGVVSAHEESVGESVFVVLGILFRANMYYMSGRNEVGSLNDKWKPFVAASEIVHLCNVFNWHISVSYAPALEEGAVEATVTVSPEPISRPHFVVAKNAMAGLEELYGIIAHQRIPELAATSPMIEGNPACRAIGSGAGTLWNKIKSEVVEKMAKEKIKQWSR